ncbi:hypothetical protein [Elizabethkingia ursingii]|uniref:Uncharacterized protein n=1 Tax=Elizabethkingia ursingii TaxID=1756150 RepID=A0ABX3N7V1_9FLAO|nr:hypothetical protein [Elizabethkingia ursingii]OPB88532.1 hypothetical protein BB021_08275 [Elizabethkingia ursingii]
MKFNDLYWHDSVIKNIVIDRNDPGKQDILLLEMDWYDTGLGLIIFEDVYLLQINMNFGIIAEETVNEAFVAPNDDIDMINFNEKWNKNLNGELSCFVIRTSSTGSEIKIIAKTFKINKGY